MVFAQLVCCRHCRIHYTGPAAMSGLRWLKRTPDANREHRVDYDLRPATQRISDSESRRRLGFAKFLEKVADVS
jgi:hypothetical protein